MTITAQQVRELRERTGAGMMECKRALEAADGSIDAAIEAMRKSGQTKADKKAGRVAAEGAIVVKISSDRKVGVMLEVNCETDFVGRDENFKHFAEKVAEKALAARTNSVEALTVLPYEGNVSVEQARAEVIAKVGENIQLRRIQLFNVDGGLASYVHSGRIGVVVQMNGGDEQLGRDIAMHIVANNPLVIERKDVSADLIAKEKEIFMAQAQASGKPAAIIEKMVEGRINKFLDEVSLIGQPFVKNPEITVGQLLAQSQAHVVQFTRYAVGEGIEKVTENFADAVDAVMAQVQGG